MNTPRSASPSPGPIPALAYGWLASAAWTLPMFLIMALLLIGPPGQQRSAERMLVSLGVLSLLTSFFFLMLKTGKTHRYRSILFVTVAVSFVLNFMPALLETRGNIALSHANLLEGKAPFCHMVIPMILLPAAATKTVIFPGSLLNGFAAIGAMLVFWLGASLTLGRGWCSWVCFFGGLDEGCSKIGGKPRLKILDGKWRYLPFAILLFVVLTSAATLSPTYCRWLCPFKTVTEFEEVSDLHSLLLTLLFVSLFVGLVIVLPILTKKRTQCGLFCPMGAFQSFTNKINIHEVVVDRNSCVDCGKCTRECPTFSITEASVAEGRTLSTCTKCGKCVDSCPKGALRFHLKGSSLSASPRLARVLLLYPAFIFITAIGGSMITNASLRVLHLLGLGGSF